MCSHAIAKIITFYAALLKFIVRAIKVKITITRTLNISTNRRQVLFISSETSCETKLCYIFTHLKSIYKSFYSNLQHCNPVIEKKKCLNGSHMKIVSHVKYET